MKINFNTACNFLGKFYATSDSHSRTPMVAGLLTDIEKRTKETNEPVFYIDGGDFLGETMPYETVRDVYKKFKERNPKINLVFNAGNTEIENYLVNKLNFRKIIKDFPKSGIDIVSLTMIDILEKNGQNADFIKPYKIVEDVVDGKKQKILITGLGEFDFRSEMLGIKESIGVDDMNRLVKNKVLPAIEKEKPDKIVFLIHAYPNNAKKVIDYAKNELGIENLELVLGGHPHSIDDYQYNGVRFLYPPAQGKGAYEVENTKSGFVFDKVDVIENDKYDYAPLLHNKSTVVNIDVNKPLDIYPDYQKILNSPMCDKYNKTLANTAVYLKYRNEYAFKYSQPTELGTLLANAYRDSTDSDIGLALGMDIREKPPLKGDDLSYYRVCDILNVDKTLNKYDNISIDALKKMLEASLYGQNNGTINKNFMEYSDNIMIDRYTNVGPDEEKIAQIYIKEDGKFKPLLDEDKKPIDDRMFSLTTCIFVANGSRSGIECFADYPSYEIPNLHTREVFVEKFKELQNKNIKKFEASIINDLPV